MDYEIAARIFFILGFLTAGLLGVLIWGGMLAMILREMLKMMEDIWDAIEDGSVWKNGGPR